MELPGGTCKSESFIQIQRPSILQECPDIGVCLELDDLVSKIKSIQVSSSFGGNSLSRSGTRDAAEFSKRIKRDEEWSRRERTSLEKNEEEELSLGSRNHIEPFTSSIPGLGKDFHLNYENERDRCRRNGTLFCDPQFPADDSSLYFQKKPKETIIWRRPHSIVEKPKFVVDGYSRFDARQGEIGDCWFIASVANLTLHDQLFNRVVPAGQDFAENYAGNGEILK